MLHHLYRAMDFLEAHKEALEEGLYFRLADLLALDVELVFYGTTSVHFEVDEEDRAPQGEGVYGSRAAGARPYRALRKRGKSKNGRDDAPQVVVVVGGFRPLLTARVPVRCVPEHGLSASPGDLRSRQSPARR